MKPSWIVLHHYVSGNNDSIAKQHRLAKDVQDKRCSYHYVVFTDGSYWMLNNPNKPKGHCGTNHPWYAKNKKTCNYNSIGVCVMGNYEVGLMRDKQKQGVTRLLAKLCEDLQISTDNIIKHRDVWATACPGKNYPYEEILDGVKEILKSSLIFSPGCSVVIFEDNQVTLEKEPVILWGVTLFPLRDLLEMLGYTVDWDKQNSMVVATLGNHTLNLCPGQKEIKIDGQRERLDHEVLNIWGTTVVPFRSLMELLGYTVNWLPESGEVQAVKY